jgi:hypothetical protein
MPVSARLVRFARMRLLARTSGPTRGARATAWAALLLVGLGGIGGCGRKASAEDCALLLDRNVEVALKSMNVTDPAAVQKKKDEIRGEMKGDMKDCVGKRITDGMLACVRKADTPSAIDSCMR